MIASPKDPYTRVSGEVKKFYVYRNYLVQFGRHERKGKIKPIIFGITTNYTKNDEDITGVLVVIKCC